MTRPLQLHKPRLAAEMFVYLGSTFGTDMVMVLNIVLGVLVLGWILLFHVVTLILWKPLTHFQSRCQCLGRLQLNQL